MEWSEIPCFFLKGKNTKTYKNSLIPYTGYQLPVTNFSENCEKVTELLLLTIPVEETVAVFHGQFHK